MAEARVRLPDDWRRFDRTGLTGLMVLSLLLAGLWATGFGPLKYHDCADLKPLELNMFSEGNKLSLTGRVASRADKNLLITAAESTYGKGNVIDKLLLDGGVADITWATNVANLVRKLKSIEQPASLKIAAGEAVLEGAVANKAAREATARDTLALLGRDMKLKNALTITAPAPPPAKPEAPAAPVPPPAPVAIAPPPTPPPAIMAGTLGSHRLPDGTEITIMGDGVESKLLTFVEDRSQAIDKNIWFDFDRLQFETGSADLTAQSRTQVEAVAAILKAYPNVTVKIGGYTDNVGDPGMNLKLSSTRAERVAKELAGLGVAADRLDSEGYGEQHPLTDNTSAEGRAKNRRTALSVRRK